MLVAVSTTQTALSANQQIPLGSVAIQTNQEARLNNGNLEIRKAGTFEILANFVFTATAAGDVTVQMQAGGVNVPGATATATATAGGTVTLPVQAPYRHARAHREPQYRSAGQSVQQEHW